MAIHAPTTNTPTPATAPNKTAQQHLANGCGMKHLLDKLARMGEEGGWAFIGLWIIYGTWLFVVFPMAAWWGWSRDRKNQAQRSEEKCGES